MTTPPAAPPGPQAPPAAPAPQTPAPAAPTPQATPGSDGGGVDARLDRIEKTVADLVTAIRGNQSSTPAALDRTQVEQITRAELDRGKQAQADAQAAEQGEARLRNIEAQVGKLTEARPRPPVRRMTKLFWPGHHDRD